MINITKIPDEARKVTLQAGKELILDTKGLDCIIKPDKEDVFLKTVKGSEDSFIIRSGEEFSFCGKVYICAQSDAVMYCLFYRTL